MLRVLTTTERQLELTKNLEGVSGKYYSMTDEQIIETLLFRYYHTPTMRKERPDVIERITKELKKILERCVNRPKILISETSTWTHFQDNNNIRSVNIRYIFANLYRDPSNDFIQSNHVPSRFVNIEDAHDTLYYFSDDTTPYSRYTEYLMGDYELHLLNGADIYKPYYEIRSCMKRNTPSDIKGYIHPTNLYGTNPEMFFCVSLYNKRLKKYITRELYMKLDTVEGKQKYFKIGKLYNLSSQYEGGIHSELLDRYLQTNNEFVSNASESLIAVIDEEKMKQHFPYMDILRHAYYSPEKKKYYLTNTEQVLNKFFYDNKMLINTANTLRADNSSYREPSTNVRCGCCETTFGKDQRIYIVDTIGDYGQAYRRICHTCMTARNDYGIYKDRCVRVYPIRHYDDKSRYYTKAWSAIPDSFEDQRVKLLYQKFEIILRGLTNNKFSLKEYLDENNGIEHNNKFFRLRLIKNCHTLLAIPLPNSLIKLFQYDINIKDPDGDTFIFKYNYFGNFVDVEVIFKERKKKIKR